MVSTQRSNLISVFVLDGRWLRASTRSISLPGWYVMTRSYCCRWRSILWNHVGAAVRFFKLIISRGLWSVSTMNVLPYRYVWNFSQPYMMVKSSLSMLAWWVSVSMRDLLANTMGCPSWMMQAPSPLSEASHWRVTSLV